MVKYYITWNRAMSLNKLVDIIIFDCSLKKIQLVNVTWFKIWFSGYDLLVPHIECSSSIRLHYTCY